MLEDHVRAVGRNPYGSVDDRGGNFSKGDYIESQSRSVTLMYTFSEPYVGKVYISTAKNQSKLILAIVGHALHQLSPWNTIFCHPFCMVQSLKP